MGNLSVCTHTAFSGGDHVRGRFSHPIALCACSTRANSCRVSPGAICPATGMSVRRASHFIGGRLCRTKVGCGHDFARGRSINTVLITGCRRARGRCVANRGRGTDVCPRVVNATIATHLLNDRTCGRHTSLVKHLGCNCSVHCFVRTDFHVSNSACFRPSGH